VAAVERRLSESGAPGIPPRIPVRPLAGEPARARFWSAWTASVSSRPATRGLTRASWSWPPEPGARRPGRTETVPAHPRRADAVARAATVYVPPEVGQGSWSYPPDSKRDPRVAGQAGGRPVGTRRRRCHAGPVGPGGPRALPPHAVVVLVHDAARPFVTRETIDGVLAQRRSGVGAVAAIPVSGHRQRRSSRNVSHEPSHAIVCGGRKLRRGSRAR